MKTKLQMLSVLLACMSWATRADAEFMGSQFEIFHYNSNGGGTFTSQANFNDGNGIVSLQGSYCIQLYNHIYAHTPYNFVYNTAGLIDGHLVANAGEVAWLVTHITPTTVGEQIALQSAIWHVAGNGGAFDLSSSDPNFATYESYLAAAAGKTAPLNSLVWMSPYAGTYNGEASDWVQGQIALNPSPVPEPSSMALASIGGVALAFCAYRRRQNRAV